MCNHISLGCTGDTAACGSVSTSKDGDPRPELLHSSLKVAASEGVFLAPNTLIYPLHVSPVVSATLTSPSFPTQACTWLLLNSILFCLFAKEDSPWANICSSLLFCMWITTTADEWCRSVPGTEPRLPKWNTPNLTTRPWGLAPLIPFLITVKPPLSWLTFFLGPKADVLYALWLREL